MKNIVISIQNSQKGLLGGFINRKQWKRGFWMDDYHLSSLFRPPLYPWHWNCNPLSILAKNQLICTSKRKGNKA